VKLIEILALVIITTLASNSYAACQLGRDCSRDGVYYEWNPNAGGKGKGGWDRDPSRDKQFYYDKKGYDAQMEVFNGGPTAPVRPTMPVYNSSGLR